MLNYKELSINTNEKLQAFVENSSDCFMLEFIRKYSKNLDQDMIISDLEELYSFFIDDDGIENEYYSYFVDLVEIFIKKISMTGKLEKCYFLIIIRIIDILNVSDSLFTAITNRVLEFFHTSDIMYMLPKETMHLIVCFFKKDHKILDYIVNDITDDFKFLFYSIDIIIIIIKEQIFLNETNINKVFSLVNLIIQQFNVFDIDDQIQFLNSLIEMIKSMDNFIFQISPINYSILMIQSIENNSNQVISKTFEFFSVMHLIESEKSLDLRDIWIQVFSSFSLKRYEKLFQLFINDGKTTSFLMNLFLLNFIDFKIILFDSHCFEYIEELQSMLITEFPNIAVGNKCNILKIISFLFNYSEFSLISETFISHIIDCFGLQFNDFPEFIVMLIENSKDNSADLKKILIQNDLINQCIDFFPQKNYSEFFSAFLENSNEF